MSCRSRPATLRAAAVWLCLAHVWLWFAQQNTTAADADDNPKLNGAVASLTDGRFFRQHWAEFGAENANPMPNGRFRVNAPEVVLHPEFGSRSEVKSSGCLMLHMHEDPRLLAGAELYLELWGGHPGTANRRVTINGRSTYSIADHGGLAHCTYQYPHIQLKRTDILNGYNALQFAVDQGQTFWGHMIVDNACLRAILADDHPNLAEHQLVGFAPTISPHLRPEHLQFTLHVPPEFQSKIARVEFQGFYTGYDENGNELTRDWHGFTKAREPVGNLGVATQSPFAIDWDTTMLPDQEGIAVRALVRFKADDKLCYQTPPRTGIRLPRGPNTRVSQHVARDMPAPFWSRASREKRCTIPLDIDPAQIDRAELHTVVWDGGAGNVQDYFTLNGQALPIAGTGKHDLLYKITPIDPKILKRGDNEIVLKSDTEHHGIEVCLPGPTLIVRTKSRTNPNLNPALNPASNPNPATPPHNPNDLFAAYALTHLGDADRGKTLFASEAKTRCAVCHKVQASGGDAGPDLTHIAGKFGRPHLIESLLDPSGQIVEGYRTTLLRLRDGQTLAGLIKEQSADQLTIIDAAGARRTLPAAEIEQRQESPLSLMPQNLVESLSPEEFTDLVAYLETLRPGGKVTPGAGITGPIKLPPGFSVRTLASGLTGATALETLPDGRVLICEQVGHIRLLRDGKLLEQPVLTLPVDSSWERGLIGVTIDPQFTRLPYIYVCCVARQPYPHHVISRFTLTGDVADPASEKILLAGDDQRTLGGKVPAGHQGGALHFGADGQLYIALGEQTAETPAQRLDTFQGKILRIHSDGSIPSDNPFLNQTTGKYQAIWARGCRNPFTFAVHPKTGDLFINDVGGKFEEINRAAPGANFGWPAIDHGPTAEAQYLGPIYWYPQASIAGAAFCPTDSPWPSGWRGRYFFADFMHGWIKTLNPDHARAADKPAETTTFAENLARPVDLRFTEGGKLLVLLRNAWVIDNKFQPATSALLEITNSPTP